AGAPAPIMVQPAPRLVDHGGPLLPETVQMLRSVDREAFTRGLAADEIARDEARAALLRLSFVQRDAGHYFLTVPKDVTVRRISERMSAGMEVAKNATDDDARMIDETLEHAYGSR